MDGADRVRPKAADDSNWFREDWSRGRTPLFHEAHQVSFAVLDEGHPKVVVRHGGDDVRLVGYLAPASDSIDRRVDVRHLEVKRGCPTGSLALGPGEHE